MRAVYLAVVSAGMEHGYKTWGNPLRHMEKFGSGADWETDC